MSRYTVYVTQQALREIRNLPGHMRQRVKGVIDGLEENPHPSGSKTLKTPEDVEVELWRIRWTNGGLCTRLPRPIAS